jgi:hypothetical protein
VADSVVAAVADSVTAIVTVADSVTGGGRGRRLTGASANARLRRHVRRR